MNQFQEKLKLTIEEIKQLTDRIISNKDITQIEIDILLSKLRDTYSLCLGFDNKQEEREFEFKEEMPKEIIELVEVFELEKVEDVVEEELEEEIEEEIELIAEQEKEEEIEPKIEKEESKEEEVKEIIEQKKTSSVLKYLNENMPKSMNFAFEEKPQVKVEVVEMVVDSVVEDIEEKEEIKLEEKEEEEIIIEEMVIEEKEIEEKEIIPETPKPTTLGERYQNQASLFESMSNKTEKIDINSKLNQSRADLRTAIGVHEKFMFINDLFSGNLREYTEFIQNLNAAESLEMAKEIIEEIKTKKRWITTSLPYSTLENVIERKFKK